MTMPGWDGLETLRRLREVDPAVRVVLSSGYSEQEAEERLPVSERTGFIQKPYRLEGLKEALLRAITTPDDPR